MARYLPGYVATAEDGATLGFKLERLGRHWTLTYTAAPDALAMAQQINDKFVAPDKPIRLAKGDNRSDIVTLFPHNFDATSPRFLQPRYDQIKSVTLKGFGSVDIDELSSVEEFLGALPTGFVRDPYRGLGLNFDIRLIIETVEKLKVDDLRIVKGARSGASHDDESYVLPFAVFETVRKDIGRVHDKALAAARTEKAARLHDKLLTPIDEAKFPAIGTPYHPDAIVKAVGDGLQHGAVFTKADASLLIQATAGLVADVAEREPAELLKLTEAVETVTLKALVAHVRARIRESHSEENWQHFFMANAFILRFAFGVPVLLFQGQATVGGRTYNGAGDKRSDFLMQAAQSGNLSIVEIKKPQTELLAAKEYRGGIQAPHPELCGGVAQALDQRWHLQLHNRALADDLRRQTGAHSDEKGPPPETYAVQCLVIIGRSPTQPNAQKSFELYRNGLNGVTVLTFDELLLKLQTLLQLLEDPDARSFVVPTVTTKKPKSRRKGPMGLKRRHR